MAFPDLNQTGDIQEENLGNTQTHANLLLQAIRNRGLSAKIGRVTDRYILIYMDSATEVPRAYNTFRAMGFEATELDIQFNSKPNQFSLRKGQICIVVIPSPVFQIGFNGIGFSIGSIPGEEAGKLKGGIEDILSGGKNAITAGEKSAEEVARLPGTIDSTAGKSAEVVGLTYQTAVKTAGEGFGIMTKVVIGSCALLAFAILIPKLIDGMATSYDRVAESNSKAKVRIQSEKEEREERENGRGLL